MARTSSTRSSAARSPIDLNTLRAMKRSPLGLDLYLWLTYRTFTLKRPIRLTWPQLYRQFGADPAKANDTNTVQNFRKDCLRELEKIQRRGRTCTIGRSRARWCSRRRRRRSRRRNCASWNSGLPFGNLPRLGARTSTDADPSTNDAPARRKAESP